MPFSYVLLVYFAVSLYLYFHVSGKGIYNGCTYTVKSSGYLVSSATEFSAGMENRMDHLYCRYTQLRMFIYRHTSSVVFYSNGIVLVYSYIDSAAESGKSFVDTVVYHFVHQMVKTPWNLYFRCTYRVFFLQLQDLLDTCICSAPYCWSFSSFAILQFSFH